VGTVDDPVDKPHSAVQVGLGDKTHPRAGQTRAPESKAPHRNMVGLGIEPEHSFIYPCTILMHFFPTSF
jgi:hypothetical protein